MEATDAADREVLTYDQFGAAARDLATAVVDSGYEPDWIVAIARGGLVIGGALGYALGLKNIATINVEFYTDVEETLPDPVLLAPHLDTDSIRGRRILVVDDVADSGRTLALVLELLQQHGAEARSAVIYGKPRSIVAPDYVWRQTDRWIVFPWSAQPPVSGSQVTGDSDVDRQP